jgi:hypothetical protein
MQITVSKFDVTRKQHIRKACMNNWEFEEISEQSDVADEIELTGQGESCLCNGESEDAFVDRISHDIWKANGAFCPVEVVATYLEDLPCEVHTRGKADYADWKKGLK